MTDAAPSRESQPISGEMGADQVKIGDEDGSGPASVSSELEKVQSSTEGMGGQGLPIGSTIAGTPGVTTPTGGNG